MKVGAPWDVIIHVNATKTMHARVARR